MAYSVAAPIKQKIRPAFIVKKLEGKVQRQMITFDSKKQKHSTMVEVDAGFLVKFRAGHSIRVFTQDDLTRLGFDQTVPLLNDEGDVVGELDNDVITEDEVA